MRRFGAAIKYLPFNEDDFELWKTKHGITSRAVAIYYKVTTQSIIYWKNKGRFPNYILDVMNDERAITKMQTITAKDRATAIKNNSRAIKPINDQKAVNRFNLWRVMSGFSYSEMAIVFSTDRKTIWAWAHGKNIIPMDVRRHVHEMVVSLTRQLNRKNDKDQVNEQS